MSGRDWHTDAEMEAQREQQMEEWARYEHERAEQEQAEEAQQQWTAERPDLQPE